MSGLTGLVDTLLAQKLSQRVDLLRLPPASAVKEPGPAPRAEPGRNDVRLPSHAALDRQMFGAAVTSPAIALADGAAEVLSSAGRAITTILSVLPADAGPVLGRSALLPLAPQPGDTTVLAQGLAACVAASGLFYESHLVAFDRGLLPRAELEQEPQAHWNAGREAAETPQDDEAAPGRSPQARPSAGDPVHPQALKLVRQQLELLATGVMRWSGEAWPGVPLQWMVREDGDDATPHARGAEAAAAWTTELSLVLPGLGPLDVRLGVRGSSVTVRVLADQRATAVRLRAVAGDLKARLSCAGLNTPELAIHAREHP